MSLVRRVKPSSVLVLAGALVLLLFPVVNGNEADQNVVILSLVLAVGAVAVNIMGGYGGYYSFGEAVHFGIGGYTVAILSTTTGTSPFLWLPAAAIVSGLFALLIAGIALRGRGHAFVILTMTALLLVQFIALQWTSLTGGPAGHSLPIPGWSVDYANWPFHYALLALLGIVLLISARIRRAKLGMGLIAMREDEGKAATIGVSTPVYKTVGFVISSAVLGIAGGIYAYYASFINPIDMFSLLFSGQLLLAMLLGGSGTLFGPVIGAFILQYLDYYGNQSFGGGNARLFIVGGLLVIVVLFLPRGLLPSIESLWARYRSKGKAALVGQRLADAADTPVGELQGRVVRELEQAAADVAEQSAPLLEVRDLHKAFGGTHAVDGCSFVVPAGSITGLIGPNGSGKTTTFNLIGGTMRADAGEVWFDGRRIDALPPWKRAYGGVGRTFQVTRLFLGMTVLENVVAPLRTFSWRQLNAVAVSGPEAARAEELLEFVGMHRFLDQPAGALSYGQRKLVELAQVLMLEPKLIMLDEPAGGINVRLIDRMGELIRELNRHGTTFLLVEHNMPFVLELTNAVHVLARGACICSGTPDEIQRDPLVLDAYLGDDFVAQEGVKA